MPWLPRWEAFSTALLQALAPDRCANCQASPLVGPLFCASCEELAALGLRQREVSGTPAWACAGYETTLRRAIQRFKFENHPEFARRFASALQRHGALAHLDRAVVLVPVPLHPRRLAERGFNQSALLARALAKRCGARTELRALAREVDTPHQSRASRRERLNNVEGRFRARRQLCGWRVVLVDDVLTTGATAHACCNALEAAGARVHGIITIAHTD